MHAVRPSAVAGAFYPGQRKKLLGVWAAELFQRFRPDRFHRKIGWDVVATSITTCAGGGSVETELR